MSKEIAAALLAADAAVASAAVVAEDRPSRGEISRVMGELRAALFPRELGLAARGEAAVASHLQEALDGLNEQIRRCAVLFAAERPGRGAALPADAAAIAGELARALPEIRRKLEIRSLLAGGSSRLGIHFESGLRISDFELRISDFRLGARPPVAVLLWAFSTSPKSWRWTPAGAWCGFRPRWMCR